MSYSICRNIQIIPTKELFVLRKENLKTTQCLWVTVDWEFDPTMTDLIYNYHENILIWLN